MKAKGGGLKAVKLMKGGKVRVYVSKTAFAKCGKSKGKGLTLRVMGMGWDSKVVNGKEVTTYPEEPKFKAFFQKYGLPSGVTIRPYSH